MSLYLIILSLFFHNSDIIYIYCNSEFIFRNFEFISHNSEFIFLQFRHYIYCNSEFISQFWLSFSQFCLHHNSEFVYRNFEFISHISEFILQFCLHHNSRLYLTILNLYLNSEFISKFWLSFSQFYLHRNSEFLCRNSDFVSQLWLFFSELWEKSLNCKLYIQSYKKKVIFVRKKVAITFTFVCHSRSFCTFDSERYICSPLFVVIETLFHDTEKYALCII